MDIILNGAAGRIQAAYHKSGIQNAPIAAVFHDYPQTGGNMNEAATYTLFFAFAQMGFNVIRFNFRGVGGTAGVFEDDEDELSDAATVVDWLQDQNDTARAFWLAGNGFGAYIALQMLMRRMDVSGYVALNAPVRKYDFSFLNPMPCSGMFLDSSAADNAGGFVSSLNRGKKTKATHKVIESTARFDGRLKELFTTISGYVGK
jgi:alpha/beta superfamily hydrolase